MDYQKRLILADVLGVKPDDLLFEKPVLSCTQQKDFEEKLTLLGQGYPLDYLLSKIEVLDLKITVFPGVFIPRPETEFWLPKALNLITSCHPELVSGSSPKSQVIDLCAGTGIIGLYLAKNLPNSQIISLEIDEKALKNIEYNREQNEIQNLEIIKSDLFKNFTPQKDWILVCNPPYVPSMDIQEKTKNNLVFEPELAIFSGEDGLELFNKILTEIKKLPIKPSKCFFELDPRNIVRASQKLFTLGYKTEIWKDQNDLDRVVVGVKK